MRCPLNFLIGVHLKNAGIEVSINILTYAGRKIKTSVNKMAS